MLPGAAPKRQAGVSGGEVVVDRSQAAAGGRAVEGHTVVGGIGGGVAGGVVNKNFSQVMKNLSGSTQPRYGRATIVIKSSVV